MPDFSIHNLEISGYSGRAVPNRLLSEERPPRGLAVILPGLRYTPDMPLLFYPARLFQQHGMDVLQLHTDYAAPRFQNLPPGRQYDWLLADTQAAIETASQMRSYPRLVFLAKSIGTLALSLLLNHQPALAINASIWVTPLLRLPPVEQAAGRLRAPGLFVAGAEDASFDGERLENICRHTGATGLVLPGANHILEVHGDLFASLENLSSYLRQIDDFLTRLGSN